MTVKHSEFAGGTNNIYFCHTAVKAVESTLAIMTFSDYNYAPRYAFLQYIGAIVPGR